MVARNFLYFIMFISGYALSFVNAVQVWERLAPTRRHARGRRLLAPDDQCAAELWSLENKLTQVVHPVDLHGHWVSSECEIHPGPKYVLRDYQFYKTGNFLIRHYEYKDDACSSPVYGFTANGNIVHLGKSWAVPGAIESTFTLNQVTVVPYTKSAAKTLTLSLRGNCKLEFGKTFDWPWLEEYRDYVIFNSPNEDTQDTGSFTDPNEAITVAEFDCLHSANFTMIQLGLLRMDEIMDPTAQNSKTSFVDKYLLRQLYFGKTVWDARNKTFIRPSSFQDPLVDVDQMTNCKICQKIKGSNPLSPPRLKPGDFDQSDGHSLIFNPASRPSSDQLDGDWISTQCESYEHGMYAHRRMTFSTAARTWHLRQRYYNDPLCKHASFTLLADGRFTDLNIHSTVSGSQHILYKIEKVKIVPESRATVHNLRRAENCGPANKWRQGRTVDVSPYGGCAPLGIAVPTVTKDVFRIGRERGGSEDGKVENRKWLFTGDYTAIEYTDNEFPTSFQSPLIKCVEMTVIVSLDTSKTSLERSPDERYGINFSKWQSNSSTIFSISKSYLFIVYLLMNMFR